MSPTRDAFNDYSQLLELVGFAVRKEIEAADFYRTMAERVDSVEIRDELSRLAKMEEGHRDKLERLNIGDTASGVLAGLGALKSANYETPGIPGPDLSRRQLLEIAIGREVAAWKLYSDMASLVPESMMRQLLANLAAEETSHRQYLERLVRGEG